MKLEGVSYAVADFATSTLCVTFLLGPCAVAFALGKLRALQVEPEEADSSLVSKRIPALKMTRQSVMLLLRELSVLGAIMLFTWACENRPFFEHAQKTHVPDFFWFICLMVLMFAIGSVHHDPRSNDLVNRDQTEEWKGWMQTVFLLYHYFHESEVYNPVRIMISCYVWMTGFGNFSFFYIKQDFGFVRFAQMLWRLNFTVLFLCFTLNNMYVLYYICPLHTFYFLLVFATMRVYKEINHTKYAIRVKLLALGILIYFIWEFNSVFELVFKPIPNDPHPGAAVGAYGIRYEWHFRSGLDHYSTLFGMIFACNFPQSTQWIKKVERLPPHQEWLIKGSTGAVLLAAFWWWATEILPLPKLQFNSWNPYTFMIPLLTYLYFRNLTPWLRQIHLGVLANIGKYTLETYLMQHHVWLTTNAKTVLVFVPDHPKVNLVLVTFVYFALARRLFRTTMVTRALLIPDSPAQALWFLGKTGFVLAGAGAAAWGVQVLELSWPLVWALVLALGIALFVTIEGKLSATVRCRDSCDDGSSGPEIAVTSWTRAVTTFSAGLVCALLAVQVVPSMIPLGAPINAGPMRGPAHAYSPQACLAAVREGSWIDSRKSACKTSNDPFCDGRAWVWTDHLAEKMCHFQYTDIDHARELVAGRELLFVGDSNTLRVAAAVYASLDPAQGQWLPANPATGDVDAGLDFTWTVDSEPPGKIHFRGAARSRDLIKRVEAGDASARADIVIAGAWVQDMKESTHRTDLALISNSVGSDRLMLLGPVHVVPTKLAGPFRTGVSPDMAHKLANEFERAGPELSQFAIDMRSLTINATDLCLDGVHYADDVYQVAAQQLFYAVSKLHPPPPRPAPAASKQLKKGKGGGIAMSPTFGILVLTLAAIMLFTMDVYGGIAAFFLKIYPPHESIDYVGSVSELHRKIGVSSYMPVQNTDVENPDLYDGEETADDDGGVTKGHHSDNGPSRSQENSLVEIPEASPGHGN